MTLLTVTQNVANETGLYDPPLSVVGNSSDDVQRVLALANRAGAMLLRTHDWNDLINPATFNTVASTETYAVESDYDRFLSDTLWDFDNNTKMRLVTDRDYTFLQNGVVAPAGIEKQWRFVENKIEIIPIPSAADTIKYNYLSNKWVLDTNGSTAYTAFQADTDTTKFPEYLLELALDWMVGKAYGEPYQDSLAMYKNELDIAVARDRGNSKIRFPIVRRRNRGNIQDGNFPAS